MSWPIIELQNVCSLLTDGTHYTPLDVGVGVPFLTVKDVSEKGLDLENCSKISEDEFKKADAGNSAPKVGDVLFSKDGTVGKVYVVKDEAKFAILSSLAILRPSCELDSDFLGHVMKSPSVLDQASKNKTGSALRRIILSDIKKLKIPLPPLPEQKRIAAILDKADAIRRKRQQAIQLADDFLRAVFLDMFGDPVTNPKGWDVKPLKDISHIQIGPFGTQLHKEDYVDNGIPLINPTHIVSGHIVPKMNLTISPEKHASLPEYHLEIGDIIMGRRGEMGRCAVVGEKEQGWLCGTGSLYIRPTKKSVFSDYLSKLLSGEAIKNYLEAESQGATMPNLNKTIVGSIQIPVPDNSTLNKFTAIKERHLCSKNYLNSFSSELIFESLSQKAFRGAL